jgi:hypothetical protein
VLEFLKLVTPNLVTLSVFLRGYPPNRNQRFLRSVPDFLVQADYLARMPRLRRAENSSRNHCRVPRESVEQRKQEMLLTPKTLGYRAIVAFNFAREPQANAAAKIGLSLIAVRRGSNTLPK